MTSTHAKSIINAAIHGYDATHLMRIVRKRGTADCIEIKEKKPTNTADQTKLDSVIASCEAQGLKYKGIGVGFDYNSNEYTMIFSYTSNQ